MRIPVLETKRLTIREYTLDDLEARHRLTIEAFASNQDIEVTRQWLQWAVMNYRELANLRQPPYGDFAVVLNATQEVIGSVGLVPAMIPWGTLEEANGADDPNRHRVTPEFGLFWAILPAYWGRGYASEATKPLIDYIFSELKARRVVATTEYDNVNSMRVMQKLGMGVRRNTGDEPPWFQVVGVLDQAD